MAGIITITGITTTIGIDRQLVVGLLLLGWGRRAGLVR
jgi:hypothetical protein